MHARNWILGSIIFGSLSISGCKGLLDIDTDSKVGDGGTTASVAAGLATCDGPLYVRIATDFSGTATDIAIPHFWGIYDYLRRKKTTADPATHLKGVRGCDIDIDVKDNNYTGAKTNEVVTGWRTTDPHWADVSTLFIFGTGPTTTVGPDIMKEKKIIIPGSYAGGFATPSQVTRNVSYPVVNTTYTETTQSESKSSPGWPYIFYPATDYGTAIRLAINAASQKSAGRMAFAHDLKDACAYCVEPLAAGQSYLSTLTTQGMSIGRDLIIPQTSSDQDAPRIHDAVNAYFNDAVNGEIVHFKQANQTTYTYDPVVWVWSGNSVFATAILAKEIALIQDQIDIDPLVTAALHGRPPWKIRVMANNWGIGETTTKICGDKCNNDVIYGLFPVPFYGDFNAPGMSELIAQHDDWQQKDAATPPPAPITPRKSGDYSDVRYVQGYAAALMWEKAVSKALDTEAAKTGQTKIKITGEMLKTALESFKGEDMGGITASPITFKDSDHRPQSAESIYFVSSTGRLQFVQGFNLTLADEWLGY